MNGFARSLCVLSVGMPLLVGCDGSGNAVSSTKRDQDRLQIELLDLQKAQAAAGDENNKLKGELDAAKAKVISLTEEVKQARANQASAQSKLDEQTTLLKSADATNAGFKAQLAKLESRVAEAQQMADVLEKKITAMTEAAAKKSAEAAAPATMPTTGESLNK